QGARQGAVGGGASPADRAAGEARPGGVGGHPRAVAAGAGAGGAGAVRRGGGAAGAREAGRWRRGGVGVGGGRRGTAAAERSGEGALTAPRIKKVVRRAGFLVQPRP